MLKSRLRRAMVAVFVLAAVAFTARGVPDDKGTDAAIGWWSFVALALLFVALIGSEIVQAVRNRERQADATAR